MKIVYVLIIMAIATVSGASEVILKWDAVEDKSVLGYKIYATGSDSVIEEDVGNITQIPVAEIGVKKDTTYTYQVTVYNACGESEKSDAVVYSDPSKVPVKPFGVRIIAKIFGLLRIIVGGGK